jgi:hypothetical protein
MLSAVSRDMRAAAARKTEASILRRADGGCAYAGYMVKANECKEVGSAACNLSSARDDVPSRSAAAALLSSTQMLSFVSWGRECSWYNEARVICTDVGSRFTKRIDTI